MKICDIDNNNIRISGRTIDSKDPVKLLWTGSYVEFRVKASTFSILIDGPFDNYENWIAIEINGEVVSRRMVNKEKEWITLFRLMSSEKETLIRIIKETQAFSSDKDQCINLYEIDLDGELLPVNDKKIKLEFIGDSITSAEGCIGAKGDLDWLPLYFSHTNSYPYMVGKKLDADVRVISQSGWGCYASWDNNLDCVIPKHYENICSLMEPGTFDKLGFSEKWDFSKWQPDAVIVNLGTNDNGAFFYEDCHTEDNLRMVDGEFVEEDRIKVRNSMTAFIKMIRKNNPNSFIIWAFGIIDSSIIPTIQEAIDIYKNETNDDKVSFLRLPLMNDDTVGSREHPGRKAHKKAAKVIRKYLVDTLKLSF